MRISLLLLLLAFGAPVAAQSRVIAPSPSRLFSPETGGVAIAAADTLPRIGDHRVTGAVIGGVLGGALGYWAATGLGGGPCTTGIPEVCYGEVTALEKSLVTIGGAAIGAGLGYLAGRSTPKGSVPDVPPLEPVPEGTGLTPAQGAGIGALVGAAAFAYWASVSEGGDGGPEDMLMIPFGALIGGFIGGGLARE